MTTAWDGRVQARRPAGAKPHADLAGLDAPGAGVRQCLGSRHQHNAYEALQSQEGCKLAEGGTRLGRPGRSLRGLWCAQCTGRCRTQAILPFVIMWVSYQALVPSGWAEAGPSAEPLLHIGANFLKSADLSEYACVIFVVHSTCRLMHRAYRPADVRALCCIRTRGIHKAHAQMSLKLINISRTHAVKCISTVRAPAWLALRV